MTTSPLVRAATYDVVTIEHILRHSEGRQSQRGSGHAHDRHVDISTQALNSRGDAAYDRTPNGGVVTAPTAFSDNRDQFAAVQQVLNSVIGQRALTALDESGRTGTRVAIEARLATPVRIRYSSGGAVRRPFLDSARVVVDRIELPCCQGIHVVTAFPVLAFRIGFPAFQVNGGPWTQ